MANFVLQGSKKKIEETLDSWKRDKLQVVWKSRNVFLSFPKPVFSRNALSSSEVRRNIQLHYFSRGGRCKFGYILATFQTPNRRDTEQWALGVVWRHFYILQFSFQLRKLNLFQIIYIIYIHIYIYLCIQQASKQHRNYKNKISELRAIVIIIFGTFVGSPDFFIETMVFSFVSTTNQHKQIIEYKLFSHFCKLFNKILSLSRYNDWGGFL